MTFKFLIVLCCLYVADSQDVDNHPNWNLLSRECGKAKETTFRIFGGQDAGLGQFPWLVRIRAEKDGLQGFICGGGLISPRHVITASHCGENSTIISVRIGEYDTKTEVDCDDFGCAPKYQDIEVLQYLRHPKWSLKTIRNDIALIKLASDAQLSRYVQPLCLPGHSNFFENYYPSGDVELAGWGNSDDIPGQVIPEVLQFVTLDVNDMKACKRYYPSTKTALLSDRQLCIGVPNGMDTCEGDSGGPVMKELKVDNEYRFYILGVVSFGSPDCGKAPAVYTNVRFYMKWILDNL